MKHCVDCEFLGKVYSLVPNQAGRNFLCVRFPTEVVKSLEVPYCGEFKSKDTVLTENLVVDYNNDDSVGILHS